MSYIFKTESTLPLPDGNYIAIYSGYEIIIERQGIVCSAKVDSGLRGRVYVNVEVVSGIGVFSIGNDLVEYLPTLREEMLLARRSYDGNQSYKDWCEMYNGFHRESNYQIGTRHWLACARYINAHYHLVQKKFVTEDNHPL